MSDKFVASNGMTVGVDQFGVGFFTSKPHGFMTLAEDEMRAMREFFRAERDEELGRWRWPENPDYVVYATVIDPARRNVRGVTVASEAIPRTYTVWEDNVDVLYGTSANEDARQEAREAARAYFAAHPEPKPWHDAKPGEVWEFTYTQMGERDRVKVFIVDSLKRFRDTNGVKVTLEHFLVLSARRVYPEVSDVQ